MQLSDFSSVLQLGVGLHAGTVLLQAIAEFASTPLSRRIERLARIARLRAGKPDASEEAAIMLDDVLNAQNALEVVKAFFFTEYKYAAIVNTVVSIALFALLVWAACDTTHAVGPRSAAALVFLSVGPALLSLLYLWLRWHFKTQGIKSNAFEFEQRVRHPMR